MNFFVYYIWILCFVSLYVAVFWLSVVSMHIQHPRREWKVLPSVTLCVPAYNEEDSIVSTVESLLALDYPQDKLTIIVVDDGSTDATLTRAHSFRSQHVRVVSQHNKGKAAAVNHGIRLAKSEIFGVFDADSKADPDSLKHMLPYFDIDTVGAVISPIRVWRTDLFLEQIQRFEYIMANFVRKLMSLVGTLHTTPGVLSLYRLDVLKTIGGFDETSLTEDYEIAMRLRRYHYTIRLCPDSRTYTYVPTTMGSLWKQRVRWFRGFIDTHKKHRSLIFNRKYDLLGMFQTPLNLLMLFFVLVSCVLLLYQGTRYLFDLFFKLDILRLDFFDLELLTLREFILNINLTLVFPIFVTFLAGIFLYMKAHVFVQEKWKFHFSTFLYLFIYPFVRSAQWIHAFILEVFKAKRKW